MPSKKNYFMIQRFFFVYLFLIVSFLSFASVKFAGVQKKDSTLRNNKNPKHYFTSLVFSSFYATAEKNLIGSSVSSQNLNLRLKTYRYSQLNSGFLIPLITREHLRKDSSVLANWHFLFTGNFLNAFPVFSGLNQQHVFCKYSIGTRSMYNNGKKDIFFFDFSPFLAFDYNYSDKIDLRISSTFIWSHVFSDKFSFRLGYTRSYIFGDRLLLPIIGFRAGRLDKTYISFQFPRSLTINIPIQKSFSVNILAKPVGNIFDFRDQDSIYSGVNKKVMFGWRDICLGGGVDFHPSRLVSCFLHLGITTSHSNIAFFSKAANANNKFKSYKWFYNEELSNSTFLNFGVSFRLGKRKIANGNLNLYEMMNLNVENDPGNNNSGSNSNEIPHMSSKLKSALKIGELSDILDDVDLYD